MLFIHTFTSRPTDYTLGWRSVKEWPLPPINTLTPPTDKIKYAALTRPGLRRILIPTVSVTRSSIYDPRTKPDLHVLNRLRDKTEQGGVNVMGPHAASSSSSHCCWRQAGAVASGSGFPVGRDSEPPQRAWIKPGWRGREGRVRSMGGVSTTTSSGTIRTNNRVVMVKIIIWSKIFTLNSDIV